MRNSRSLCLFLSILLTLTVFSMGAPRSAHAQQEVTQQSESAADQARGLELIHSFGGAVSAVAIQGDFVYFGESFCLTVLDNSDPEKLIVVGRSSALPDLIQNIAIAGDYAYVVAKGAGLYVFDITNPLKPSIAGSLDTPGEARGVTIRGNTAFIADGGAGLRIIDITDPKSPQEIGALDTTGTTNEVALADDLAYLADGKYLRTVDISNLQSPVELSAYTESWSIYFASIAAVGKLAYATNGQGLQIFDMTNPAAPVEVSSTYAVSGAFRLRLVGAYAYVNGGSYLVEIFDITKPAAPIYVGQYGRYGGTTSLAIAGNRLYATTLYGLYACSIADPKAPVLTADYSSPGPTYDVALDGNLLYTAASDGGLQIFDIKDLTKPAHLGHLDLGTSVAWNVCAAGNIVIVRAMPEQGGRELHFVDVSDPTAPVELAKLPDIGGRMVAKGSTLYVANGFGGLYIIDFSDPAAPKELGHLEMKEPSKPGSLPGDASDVVVVGNYAYVAAGSRGLRIIDVSNPAIPVAIGAIENLASATTRVAVQDGLAFVIDYGLRIVDVSNPAQPQWLGTMDIPFAKAVTVIGGMAFVPEGGSVFLIDVTNPIKLNKLDSCPTPGEASEVTTKGFDLFVADQLGGVSILRVTGLPTVHLPTMLK